MAHPENERPARARLRALAKLTLSLRVTGVRNDGFHLLESEMITIDLADEIYICPGDGLEVELEGLAAIAGQGEVSAEPSNLVTRALQAAGARARAKLLKRIPVGAGLGGGSADAAAVLRWAGLSLPRDAETARQLGSDVPFCLSAAGHAVVSGAGEKVEPLPWDDVAASAYTLLVPPFGVPTGAVYRTWDELGGRSTGSVNDLEDAALRVEPRLAVWRDRLGEASGKEPTLAGSGSTWYVAGEYPGPQTMVVRAAKL